jgi:methionyl-tRNA synthetase
MDDKKMSKSLGNVLNPFEVLRAFGADALRYYCLREVSFGQDGNVSAKGFEDRYETELANEYGNLASRTLAMIGRYTEGVVPEAAIDASVKADFDGLSDQISALIDRFELTPALELIWQRVRRLNRYVEERAPWQLARDASTEPELHQTLASLAEGLRVVSVLLHPYMPSATERLLHALGAPETAYAGACFNGHGSGQRVEALEPLFPKRA